MREAKPAACLRAFIVVFLISAHRLLAVQNMAIKLSTQTVSGKRLLTLLLIFAGLRITRTVARSLHSAIRVCEEQTSARPLAHRRLESIVVHQQSRSSRISSSLRLSLRLRTLRMRKRRADGAAKTRSFCFWRSHCSSAIRLESNSLSPRNKRQFWPFIF